MFQKRLKVKKTENELSERAWLKQSSLRVVATSVRTGVGVLSRIR